MKTPAFCQTDLGSEPLNSVYSARVKNCFLAMKNLKSIAEATVEGFEAARDYFCRARRVLKLYAICIVKQELPMLLHGKTLFSLHLTYNFQTE